MGYRIVGILLSVSGLVVMAGAGCGQTDEPIGGLSCGPGMSNVDGVCLPTDEPSGTGGAGGSADASAASTGGSGVGEGGWTGCPVDAPGSPMVEVHMPDGTPYCIDVRRAEEADYAAFLDSDPPIEGLPPELCSELTDFGPIMGPSETGAVWVNWCTAYAYCAWAGKRLCGRVEGNGGGVNDSEWYNACSDGGAHAYAWGDDVREQCANPSQHLPECVSEPYGLVGIGESPTEWTADCEPAVASEGIQGLACWVFNLWSGPSVENTCDAANTWPVVETSPELKLLGAYTGVRCCF